MTGEPVLFNKPQSVRIDTHRWNIQITVIDQFGTEHKYFASSDAFFTDGDGIWFGTDVEYAEAQNHP